MFPVLKFQGEAAAKPTSLRFPTLESVVELARALEERSRESGLGGGDLPRHLAAIFVRIGCFFRPVLVFWGGLVMILRAVAQSINLSSCQRLVAWSFGLRQGRQWWSCESLADVGLSQAFDEIIEMYFAIQQSTPHAWKKLSKEDGVRNWRSRRAASRPRPFRLPGRNRAHPRDDVARRYLERHDHEGATHGCTLPPADLVGASVRGAFMIMSLLRSSGNAAHWVGEIAAE